MKSKAWEKSIKKTSLSFIEVQVVDRSRKKSSRKRSSTRFGVDYG